MKNMKKLLFAAMTAVLTMNAGSADAQTKESPSMSPPI